MLPSLSQPSGSKLHTLGPVTCPPSMDGQLSRIRLSPADLSGPFLRMREVPYTLFRP